ncbi:TonB-dependent receptor plug domain-containing protein [Terrimonas ferruginea]|uniref:TonB-dependent receptor plug domain-containing protein n=1 Tax=Terrimonas ferruginea TaxID=249 RepID=UPI0004098A75|nr:TonB-dependent receptor [Terrimonas ferruginea]
MKHKFSLFAFILFSTVACAQEQEQLDGVTITSSLTEKRASETGRNISIVRGDQMAGLPVHSIDDLLRYLPGVETQARGPLGAQSDFVLRGGTFQQVLVILDGLRLNDPNTGHFNSYIPITPAEIDRVEVLKGASSAIYGADAVGGVIHIITKSFAARQQQPSSASFSGRVAGGEYGFSQVSAGGTYRSGKLQLGGGLLVNNTDGVPQRGIPGFVHNRSVSASAAYFFNPYWSLAYRGAFDSRDFAAQNFYTSFLSDTANEKVSSWWHQARLSYRRNKTRVSLDAGYKTLEDEYRFNPSSLPNQSKSKLFQSLLVYQYQLNTSGALTAGFNYQQKMINSNDRGKHSLYLAAPFVSLNQKIGEHFTLQPSLRTEFIEGLDAEWIPQLTASWRQGAWQWRASGGKTIRDADFTERFNNYAKPFVASGRIGNPDLKAEHSWSYEAGADWFFHKKLKLSATFFQRYHRQLIDYVTTAYADMPRKENLSPTGTYALARNIARVETSGFEADLQYVEKFGPGRQLSLTAGITWLDSRSSDGTSSLYVSSHARFLSNFSALYQWGHFSMSVNGLYKKRAVQQAPAIQAQLTRDYFVMNVQVSWAIWQNKLMAFAQADNLFDRSYSDLLGAPMPGRWVLGGLRFAFAK